MIREKKIKTTSNCSKEIPKKRSFKFSSFIEFAFIMINLNQIL